MHAKREIRCKTGALIGSVYEALANFESHYVPYYSYSVTVGRSFMVKTDQVVPLVPSWIKKVPVRGNVSSRLRSAAHDRWTSTREFFRYLEILCIKAYRTILRVGSRSQIPVFSTIKSVGHEVVLGSAKSCHVEVECGSPTELWQDVSRTFLSVGKRQVAAEKIFAYPASDARDRQHFYTTKSFVELFRVIGGLRHERPALEALPQIKLWIAYRVEWSLSLSYVLGTAWVLATSILFLFLYDPSGWYEPSTTRAAGFQTALVLGSAVLSFMMNWRAKENIVADRLFKWRVVVLTASFLSFSVLFGGLIYQDRFCAAKRSLIEARVPMAQHIAECQKPRNNAGSHLD